MVKALLAGPLQDHLEQRLTSWSTDFSLLQSDRCLMFAGSALCLTSPYLTRLPIDYLFTRGRFGTLNLF